MKKVLFTVLISVSIYTVLYGQRIYSVPDFILHLAAADSNNGFGAVKAFGRFNDDCYDDLVVLAPHFKNSMGEKVGKACLYYGTARGIDTTSCYEIEGMYPIVEITGSELENRGLHSLAIGDFNNDSYDDLAIGTPWYERLSSGVAYARGYAIAFLSNADGSGLNFRDYIEFLGLTPIGNFAYSMVAGDVNGDLIHDLIVSARYDEGIYEGRIYIYFGGENFDNIYDFLLKPSPGGKSLFCTNSGDINGDGLDDIIGIDNESAINSPDFRLNVWLGANNIDRYPNFSRSIPYKQICAVSDLNGDSFSDIIITDAFQHHPPNISPNLTIIGGDTIFDIESTLEIILDGHHSAVSSIKDVNNDGLNDIFVNLYDKNDNCRIYVFAGDVTNYVNLADTLLTIIDSEPSYGLSVEDGVPADMDGDGEIELYAHSQMSAYKDVIFIYNANFPSISISYPDHEGIELKTGKNYNVTWFSKGNVGSSVKIELFKSDLFSRLIAEGTDNDGSFTWTVPPDMMEGSDYKIKISSTVDQHVFDFSDYTFTINKIPVLKVTYPDTAGTAWYWGETYTIRWQSWGEVGPYVKLEISKDDLFYRTINFSSLNEGFYRFTISPIDSFVGINFKIKITAVRNDSIFDFSDYPFAIFQTVGVDNRPSVIYKNKLYPNYPNPFNANTTIRYEISQASNVRIRIYNLLGELVKVLRNTHQSAGAYEVFWDGLNEHDKMVAGGIFIVEMRANEFLVRKKITLLK